MLLKGGRFLLPAEATRSSFGFSSEICRWLYGWVVVGEIDDPLLLWDSSFSFFGCGSSKEASLKEETKRSKL